MREFVKSFSSFSLGISFLGLQLMKDMITPTERGERKGPAARTLDSVVNATAEQFDSTLRATFRAVDNVQRGITGIVFDTLWASDGSRTHAEDRQSDAERQDEIDSIYERQQRDEASIRDTQSAYPMSGTLHTEQRGGRKVVITEMPATASRKSTRLSTQA